MRMTWAVVCRKANEEELTVSRGELMTHLQASITPLGQPEFHMPEYLTPKIIPTTFDLMSLSFDLRRAILQQMIPPTTTPFFLRPSVTAPGTGIPWHPTTALTKQLRTESLLVALHQTEIEIHSPDPATSPSSPRPEQSLGRESARISTRFDVVHRLSFPYFSRFLYNWIHPADSSSNDIELMRKCTHSSEKFNSISLGLGQNV